MIESTHPPTAPPSGEPAAEGGGPTPSPALLQRLVWAFSQPAHLYRHLARTPHWVAPLLVVALLQGAVIQAVLPLTHQSQIDMIERNPNLEEAARSSIRARMDTMLTPGGRLWSSLAGSVGLLIWLVLIAGVLFFGGNTLLGGQARFVQVLSVTAHAWLPYHLVTSAITLPLMLAKESMAVTTSLQIVLPFERWTTPLGVLLGAIDPLLFWLLALLITGLCEIYGFRRSQSTALVVSLYAVFTGVAMGLMLILQGIMPA